MAEHTDRFRAVNLGETIKREGRSRRWVANKAGIHETLLAHFIAGRRNAPEETAIKISEALNVDFSLLFVSADQNDLSAQTEGRAA